MKDNKYCYDSQCRDLAEAFINDTPGLTPTEANHVEDLAQRIQDTVEDYLREHEGGCPKCGSKNVQVRGAGEYCGDCGCGEDAARQVNRIE